MSIVLSQCLFIGRAGSELTAAIRTVPVQTAAIRLPRPNLFKATAPAPERASTLERVFYRIAPGFYLER